MPLVGIAFAVLVAGALVVLRLQSPVRRAAELRTLRRPLPAAALGMVVLAAGVLSVQPHPDAPGRDPGRPNIVLIMVDDLDVALLNQLAAIPRDEGAPPSLTETLGARGMTFSNAFVVDPLCCPARASLLRGQYPHNHGVWQNGPDSGYAAFQPLETDSLGVWLQSSGYRTGLVGKYMNGYGDDDPAAGRDVGVPPGWEPRAWRALFGTASYWKYHLNSGGIVHGRSRIDEFYQTTLLSKMARSVVSADDGRPFFLLVAPGAPHNAHPTDDFGAIRDAVRGRAVPAPEFARLYQDATLPDPGSLFESDLSDKPAWVREESATWRSGRTLSALREDLREQYVARLQAMASVEQMVASLVEELGSKRRGDTYIIFTSDNGWHAGEHSLPPDKRTPYEEDIRVPLIIVGPGIAPGSVRDELVTNLDLTPTILEITGATPAVAQDGRSLLPLLAGGDGAGWRDAFVTEYQSAESDPLPSWRGLRTTDYSYVRWSDGFIELYDLHNDPLELENIAPDEPDLVAELEATLQAREACVEVTCFIRTAIGRSPGT
jgi:arylsulfatase A-like enzyme